MTKAELHKQVDDDWKRYMDVVTDPWGALWVMHEWKAEKEYVDRYGQRYPLITNIKVPE